MSVRCNDCYRESTKPAWLADLVARHRNDQPCEKHAAEHRAAEEEAKSRNIEIYCSVPECEAYRCSTGPPINWDGAWELTPSGWLCWSHAKPLRAKRALLQGVVSDVLRRLEAHAPAVPPRERVLIAKGVANDVCAAAETFVTNHENGSTP